MLLDALAGAIPTIQGPLSHEDIDLLRSLPIYPTLASGRVSLQSAGGEPGSRGCAGVCSREDVAAVFGSMEALPAELKVGGAGLHGAMHTRPGQARPGPEPGMK